MKNHSRSLLRNIGFNELTPIQELAENIKETDKNLIMYAQTGSGKTFAFLLHYLKYRSANNPSALIVSPTRELALQIAESFKSLKTDLGYTVCYGGHSMQTEINNLSACPELIIGTPGRIVDHLQRETLDLSSCSMLIVDEFDKCLEMGFENEMGFIKEQLISAERSVLVSATKITLFPSFIDSTKYRILEAEKKESTSQLTQYKVMTNGNARDTLIDLINSFDEKTMVFCNYREVVDDINDLCFENDISAIAYHGGMSQEDRQRALIKFRNGSVQSLICTDLGARGLDIDDVKHIIHYQYPSSEDAFIHREGRTARMDKSGASYLIVDDDSQLPYYISLPEKTFKPASPVSNRPEFITLYFSGGKKDKINKIDIVGFLFKQGGLQKDEIGLIDVLDHASYVAISKDKSKNTLQKIRGQKIKGKRLKIAISK